MRDDDESLSGEDEDLGRVRPLRRCPECPYFERARRVVETRRRGWRTRTIVAARFVWSSDHCPMDGNRLEENCRCGADLVSPTDSYCRACGKRYWWLADAGHADLAVKTWQSDDNKLEDLGDIRVYAVHGSLTRVEADAVVSSDDIHGAMKSRSARAIRREGGNEIEAESTVLRRHLGEAWLTTAGKLQARRVIHVAVLDLSEETNEEAIREAMRSCLKLASQERLRSIALPPLGTGHSGFPMEKSVTIAREALLEHAQGTTSVEAVGFVLFSPDEYARFRAAYRVATPSHRKRDATEVSEVQGLT